MAEKLSTIFDELWKERLSEAQDWAIEGGCRMGAEETKVVERQCRDEANELIKRIREAEDDL